ncbi:hypothetical protein HYH03_008902 [Edaphochlamys debaryana]|uniref:Uncharacterized protein n=1 Tax=Edaphochlamys debaryana TaxID=47281 RepID=A0A835XYU5_9CHLO|nr:hypothetical protein HYH03_008902 [Edaphochlamys debaryana]|eukprot:KAG2492736.1 hypothetical protein HYH03_008902 [Edaphochlamys debaryana]
MAPLLSDENVIKGNWVATMGLAIPAMVAPVQWHKAFFAKDQPNNPDLSRLFALGMMSTCTSGLIAGASDDPKTKKRYLKQAGVAWLAAAALVGDNVRRGVQRKETCTAAAAGSAALGAFLLARGFKKD